MREQLKVFFLAVETEKKLLGKGRRNVFENRAANPISWDARFVCARENRADKLELFQRHTGALESVAQIDEIDRDRQESQ